MSQHQSFFSLLRNYPERRVRDAILNVTWTLGPSFFTLLMRDGCFQGAHLASLGFASTSETGLSNLSNKVKFPAAGRSGTEMRQVS